MGYVPSGELHNYAILNTTITIIFELHSKNTILIVSLTSEKLYIFLISFDLILDKEIILTLILTETKERGSFFCCGAVTQHGS
jgi:hypothetical protein